MLRKLKQTILKQLGIAEILENQQQTMPLTLEVLKAFVFNSTIADSEWLKYKSFSPGGWAVDYAFLYTLYRVLNEMRPKSVLEFGLGQSSKLIHQYALFYQNVQAITCEHDPEWITFFKNSINSMYRINIKEMELDEVSYKNEKTLSYKDIERTFEGQQFDLIVADAPFGSKRYSRSQILSLAKTNLTDPFCIIIDDYGRKGEQETVNELMRLLNEMQVQYKTAVYSGSKQHFLLCSESLKFLTSM
jgi:16S rRNA G966 N2-methylase RsmD